MVHTLAHRRLLVVSPLTTYAAGETGEKAKPQKTPGHTASGDAGWPEGGRQAALARPPQDPNNKRRRDEMACVVADLVPASPREARSGQPAEVAAESRDFSVS
jgi:hypothetical protein